MAITSKTILIAGSLGDLELLINASIDDDGMQPSGPIFVTVQGQYAQAMIEGTEQDSISGMQDDIASAQADATQALSDAADAQDSADTAVAAIEELGASFAVSDDGAVDPVASSDSLITQHVLSKATAGAYTLGYPDGSSRIIVLTSTTAAAHVVTLTDAVVRDGTATATYNTLTFAAQIGASIMLSSVGGHFVVLSKSNVTLSTV